MWPLAARFQLLTSPVTQTSRSRASASKRATMWVVNADMEIGFMAYP